MCLVILSVTAAPIEKRAKKYHGTGTWYDAFQQHLFGSRENASYLIPTSRFYRFVPEKEGGIYGACGPKEDSESMIVALNAEQYGNMNKKSKFCGSKILVKVTII